MEVENPFVVDFMVFQGARPSTSMLVPGGVAHVSVVRSILAFHRYRHVLSISSTMVFLAAV